jgi:hypothetical protein
MTIRALVLGSMCLVVPVSAWGQAHLQLLGGVTRTAAQDPFFAGSLGVRLKFIEFDVEAGRFNNILPRGVLDALNDLQRDRGLPVEAIASVPATYAFAALRIIPGIGGIRPFVQAGAGMARLSPRIDISVQGIDFGDVFGLTSLGSRTEPMAVAGAGLRIGGRRAHLEAGYRYVVVFTDFRGFNARNDIVTYANVIYGAIGAGF